MRCGRKLFDSLLNVEVIHIIDEIGSRKLYYKMTGRLVFMNENFNKIIYSEMSFGKVYFIKKSITDGKLLH